jgi:hypothetical protein
MALPMRPSPATPIFTMRPLLSCCLSLSVPAMRMTAATYIR